MSEKNELRAPVIWFAIQMEDRLRENDDRGQTGWETMSTGWLLTRMKEEVRELEQAAFPLSGDEADVEAIVRECADVANFAMMVADNANMKWNFGRRSTKVAPNNDDR